METIHLLDCTLRDGGYINDWRFGKEAIEDIKGNLEHAGVDILEIGFLKNEPYQTDRTVFNCMAQVKELIGKKQPGVRYAVMSEVVNPLPLELLDPADEESADIIRVIIWKTKHDKNGNIVDALDEGFEYCKGIVERGYKLCVQPARVDQYSEEEFVQMVRRFAALEPLAIYVVDSWGTQHAEQLLRYMHLVDDNMPAGICLGYHGHNNMMQALGVAQVMLKEKFDREIILDASIYGIGRGAGNLNTEIIAQYLNENYDRGFQVLPMLELYDRYLKDIFAKTPWGYSPAFFMTAYYNCNPNYANYYEQDLDLSAFEIGEILAQMSQEDKIIYSKKAAEYYLKTYRESKR